MQHQAAERYPEWAEERGSFTSYLSDSSFSLWGISLGLPRRDSCRKTQFQKNQSSLIHDLWPVQSCDEATNTWAIKHFKTTKVTAVISRGLYNRNAITKEGWQTLHSERDTISFISENFGFKKCFLQIHNIKMPWFCSFVRMFYQNVRQLNLAELLRSLINSIKSCQSFPSDWKKHFEPLECFRTHSTCR